MNKKLFLKTNIFEETKIEHAFFTRNGGASDELLSSLNFRMKANNKPIEKKKNLLKNKKVVADYFDVESDAIKILHQVHGIKVKIISNDDNINSTSNTADAWVTNLRKTVLAITTADCCPILLADETNEVIGAVHAGWRGAFDGIIENTIASMISLGAQSKYIKAAIGPSIAQETYEVDERFYNIFLDDSFHNKQFFYPSKFNRHYMFNLKKYVSNKLKAKNINTILDLEINTYFDEENFFSCRRAYHRDEPYFGCHLSAIMLK